MTPETQAAAIWKIPTIDHPHYVEQLLADPFFCPTYLPARRVELAIERANQIYGERKPQPKVSTNPHA